MNARWSRLARWFLLLLALVALLVAPPQRPAAAQTEKQKGMSFTAWWTGLYGTPESARSLQQLKDTGATWISLIVTQYQNNLSSTAIGPTEGTPTDAEVIATIQEAHRLGLKVMLKPHVDLWSDPSHWRGQIGDNFTTETQWTNWFASYKTFINHYAAIARDQNVEQFSVGVELIGTEARAAQWRSVIAGVRAIYSGPITYAANHSGPEMGLTWWDAVDLIGVDAYYPLATVNNPTPAQLAAAWAPIVSDLEALHNQWNKPIIFTEVGYRSINGAAQHPWDWQIGATVDLQEQSDLYQALLTAIYNKSWFQGIFWWDWSYDPYQGGTCDTGYTVYDKPAENVLRSWYGAPSRQIGVFPDVDDAVSLPIYTDALASGWEDWSWGISRNFQATNQVYAGTHSISVTANQPWAGLYLHKDGINTSPYYFVEFYLRTGSASTELYVTPYDPDEQPLGQRSLSDCRYTGGAPLQAQTWTRVRIPLQHMSATGKTISGLTFQVGDTTGSFWIDNLRLVGASGEQQNLPVIFAAAEDTYANQASPNSRYGTAAALRVKNAASDFNTFLKFNVNNLDQPVERATLRLYVTDAGPDSGAVYAVSNDYRNTTTPWVEGGLNWKNAPIIPGTAVAPRQAAVLRQWVEWDVSSVVTGNGVYSFAVRNNSSNVVYYSSAEGARPPQLVVNLAP